jgi:hypothetical protein
MGVSAPSTKWLPTFLFLYCYCALAATSGCNHHALKTPSGTGGASGGIGGGAAGASAGVGGGPAGAGGAAAGAGGAGGPSEVGIIVGHPVLRHLTNLEYDLTARDLLGIPGVVLARRTFQPDELVGDFAVIGDGQTFNDARVEQYMDAAETLAAMAFADPALQKRILTCEPASPGDTACTTAIVTAFGQRAWRRPLQPDEIKGLVDLASAALAGGATFQSAIQSVVTALMSSAPFLMRIEIDPDPTSTVAHPLGAYELASRLSYLLWSSMPDDHLRQSAASGQLLTDTGLASEVDRMLADGRSDGFVEGFAAEWLEFAREATVPLDPVLDAALDQATRDAMGQELRLYAGAFVQEDRDFTTFPSADVNFVNDALARLYGLPAPGSGASLTRVTNAQDARAGFLGLGGFLTGTSVAGRSSPTERGRWILQRLLCTEVPPPPGGTPDFISPGQPMTGRALVDSIHAQPACSGCHDPMDGIGVALEAFDEIGRPRTKYADGTAVDTRGQLAGMAVDGEPALAAAVGRDPRLLSCASRKLMSFAVNRTLGDADAPYADQILKGWTGGTPTLRGLIKQIVVNDTFKLRRGEGP